MTHGSNGNPFLFVPSPKMLVEESENRTLWLPKTCRRETATLMKREAKPETLKGIMRESLAWPLLYHR